MLGTKLILILPLVVAVTFGQTNRGYEYYGTSNVRDQRPQPIYGNRPLLLPMRPVLEHVTTASVAPPANPAPAVPVVSAPDASAAPAAPEAPSYASVVRPRPPLYTPGYRPLLPPRPIRPIPPPSAIPEQTQPAVVALPQPSPSIVSESPVLSATQPPPVEAINSESPITQPEPVLHYEPSLEPVIEPRPELAPRPEPVHEPQPEPVLLPKPISQPEPVLHYEPILEPVTEPQPELASRPESVLEPEYVPQPQPVSQPKPISQPEPVPQPQPVLQPEPVSQPQPLPLPEPIPQPQPVPEPEPVSQPQPVLEPEPVSQPQPVSEPEPVSPPQPAFEPVYEPQYVQRPEFAPRPEITSQIQPVPQPEPVIQPELVPQHEPVRQPEPVPQPQPVPQPPLKPQLNPAATSQPSIAAPITSGALVALPPLLPKPKPIREPAFGRHPQPTIIPPVNYYPTPSYPKSTLAPPVVVTTNSYPPVTRPHGNLKLDFLCKEGNGFYSVKNECDTYIECEADKATKYSCPDGLHFNPAAKHFEYPCAYPSEVQCEAGAEEQNPKPTDKCPNQYGYYSMNDGDCSKFIMCQEGLATIMDCPMGLVFNPQSSSCDWPANVPQCNPNVFKDFTCPEPPKDEYGQISDIIYHYRYGVQCKLYVACQLGHPRLLSCDRGLSFDDASQSCIDEDYVTDCAVPY